MAKKGVKPTIDNLPDIKINQDLINPEASKQEKFLIALFETRNVQEAGRKAGYAETVVKSGRLYQMLQEPKTKDQLKSIAIAHDWQAVSKLYQLEAIAIDEATRQAQEDPESAIKNLHRLKDTTKAKKVSVGILQSDIIPASQPTINIQSLQVLMSQIHQPS